MGHAGEFHADHWIAERGVVLAQTRRIGLMRALLIVCAFCAFLWPVSAQTRVDSNKYAVIINGAGGEQVYAKQFEEWTTQLSGALSGRFGFDKKQINILTN